jgi:hypothetical protein
MPARPYWSEQTGNSLIAFDAAFEVFGRGDKFLGWSGIEGSAILEREEIETVELA